MFFHLLVLSPSQAATPDEIVDVAGLQLASPLPTDDPAVKKQLAQTATLPRIMLAVREAPKVPMTYDHQFQGLEISVNVRNFWMDKLQSVELLVNPGVGANGAINQTAVEDALTVAYGEPTYWSQAGKPVWRGNTHYIVASSWNSAVVGSVELLQECEHWMGMQCQFATLVKAGAR